MSASNPIVLDHLVVAAHSLAQGEAFLRGKFGIGLDPGGVHAGFGTHNRLLQIGGGTYLELIAPDPDQPHPDRPRPFGLDDPALQARIAVRPHLVHFIARTDHIAQATKTLGHDPGPTVAMTRGDLAWEVTLNRHPDGALANIQPGLIHWGRHDSPGDRLPPRGVVLQRLHVFGPETLLSGLRPFTSDKRFHLRPDPVAMLAAEFMTPAGWAILD